MHKRMIVQRCALLGLALLIVSCTGTLLESPPGSEDLGPVPTLAQKQRGIWILGGLSSGSIGAPIGQVDLYDPVLDTWYAGVTTLPTAVSFAAACSWGGRLYVFGGFPSNGSGTNNLVQIYDVTSGVWSTENMPAARANISAVVASNKIYVLGGTTGNAADPYATSNASYEYAPSLTGPGSWITKINMAAVGSERFLLPFNDVVYGMGGRTTATAVSATHDGLAVSTPPNGVLTTVVEIALTSARTGMSGVLYAPGTGPAIMAVVGGFTALTATTGNFIVQGTTASTALTPSIFQYLRYPFIPPLTWTNAASNYPLQIGFGASALSGSSMYVFGGTANVIAASATGLSNVYRFDLDTISTGGAWTAGAGMPVGRYGHAAVAYRP